MKELDLNEILSKTVDLKEKNKELFLLQKGLYFYSVFL